MKSKSFGVFLGAGFIRFLVLPYFLADLVRVSNGVSGALAQAADT